MAKRFWYIATFFLWTYGAMAQTTDTSNISSPQISTPEQLTVDTTSTPTQTVTPQQILPTVTVTTTQTPQSVKTPTVQLVDPNPRRHWFRNPSMEKLNKQIALLYKDTFDRKTEIVIKNKRYRIYNNFITAGAGACYNSGVKGMQLNAAFDYNFHVKKNNLQLGFFLAGPSLLQNSSFQIHAGWGYKKERCNYVWAAYGGVSYTAGYRLLTDSTTEKISAIGLYATVKVFYKLNFDYGIGASTFIDANAKQTVVGLRVELIFSGAYKGFKKINWAKEDAKDLR